MRRTSLLREVVCAAALVTPILLCGRISAQVLEPAPVAPPSIREQLLTIGFPQKLADYFSAVEITVLSVEEHAFSYRETHPDGATRDVVYAVETVARYAPSPGELADMRGSGVHVLRSEFGNVTDPAGAISDEIRFFVPYDEMSAELRDRFRPSVGIDWPAWLGIRTAIAQSAGTEGLSGIQRATILEGSEQSFGQAMDMVGGKAAPLGAGVAAGIDLVGAVSLHTETQEYYRLLDELERCARNPDHGVPVPEAERQRTLDTLSRIRSELKRVTAVRFLNQVADAPLSATSAAGPVGAAVARGLSVALKPISTWSDESLQSYIRNTLLREAQAAVVPCRPGCDGREQPVPQLRPSISTGAPSAQATVRGLSTAARRNLFGRGDHGGAGILIVHGGTPAASGASKPPRRVRSRPESRLPALHEYRTLRGTQRCCSSAPAGANGRESTAKRAVQARTSSGSVPVAPARPAASRRATLPLTAMTRMRLRTRRVWRAISFRCWCGRER